MIAERVVQLVIDNWPSSNAKRCISSKTSLPKLRKFALEMRVYWATSPEKEIELSRRSLDGGSKRWILFHVPEYEKTASQCHNFLDSLSDINLSPSVKIRRWSVRTLLSYIFCHVTKCWFRSKRTKRLEICVNHSFEADWRYEKLKHISWQVLQNSYV